MEPTSAIAAAVTPVVMISANAILIGSVSSKHEAMAGRLRTLTAEYRNPATALARRRQIRAQLLLFEDRFRWIARSHFLLYVATACFTLVVLAIALTAIETAWATLSFPLLLAGVALTLVAIVLELLDLRKATATICLEVADMSGDAIPSDD